MRFRSAAAHTPGVGTPQESPRPPTAPAGPWDAWGAGREPRWSPPVGPTASSWFTRAQLPGLTVAAAAVALTASFLPYFRVSFGNGAAVFEVDGWQQHVTSQGTPSGATFLPQGVGLGIQVLGAGMVLSYGAVELSQAVLRNGQFDGASMAAGGWLLGTAGLICLVVVVLSLQELAAALRQPGSELGAGGPQVGEDDAGGTLLQPGQPG
jgi:hypothetical protein